MATTTERGMLERIDSVATKLERLEAKKAGDRIWDVLLKALVPAVTVLVGAVVIHEVRLGRIEERMEGLPPRWLRDGVERIEAGLKDLEGRIRIIEQKVK